MPKPNYAFAKRQRDLAKRQKKEEKLQERKARKAAGLPEEDDAPEGDEDDEDAPPGADALGSAPSPSQERGG